jgi:mitochondrial fission protein ELM1
MGNRAGDNNQLLALAGALGWPFVEKRIAYNQLRRVPFLRSGLNIVASRSRALIEPPWPDLVIGTGYGSVPVARHIRKQSGGRTKLVHIGNPRENIDDFDLQITTPQYAREAAPNMLELPFPIGNPARAARVTPPEREWLRDFVRPRRLIAIGGPARFWELDHAALENAIRTIQRKEPRGSVIVAVSARTRPKTRDLLDSLLTGPHEAVVETFPSFATLLAQSDEIRVTADSVSMLSEAVLSGKPVGMIPIRRSVKGLLNHWLWERPSGRASLPNFQNFWKLLHDRRLVGTVELPVASQVCDTVDRAAGAVRQLLAAGEAVDERKAQRGASDLGDHRSTRGRQQSGDRPRGSAKPAVRDQALAVQPLAPARPSPARALARQPDE